MPSKKHYIITSITLGAIAASSGLLIGLSNLITKDRIAKNEQDKILSGICAIYGEKASIGDNKDIEGKQYVEHYYDIKEEDTSIGLAFRTSGSNSYGKVTLIVGFDYTSHSFKGMYVIVNEQTYASTLVDNYINPINDGQREIADVSCGATYGAKLVKAMIDEASTYLETMWNK